MMADCTGKLYANPSAYPSREVALPDASTDGRTTVQLLTEKGVNTADPAIAQQIALVGNVSDFLSSLFETTEIDSCYVALPSGVMILADDSSSLSQAGVTIIVLIVVVMALALTGALVLSKRIVRPLGLITKRVQSLGGDDLQFVMEDDYRMGDEVEALADSFAKLSAKTLQYVDQVTRVTAEKERRGCTRP